MKKAEAEKIFVQEIVKRIQDIGLDFWCEMDEGRHTYYCFTFKNGSQRFWTDMSDENLAIIKAAANEDKMRRAVL